MNSAHLHFNGLCMVPGRSWNAKMEMEHWARYAAFLPAAAGKSCLDVASGEGYGSDLLAERAGSVLGVDLSGENVRHASSKYAAGRTNLRFLQADATRELPAEERSFDLVSSFETIEHLENPEGFLEQVRRVLRPGGAACISTPVPNVDPESGRPFNRHHFREYGADDFMMLLRRNFRHVVLAGQSAAFPSDLHGEFRPSGDRYIIGIASDDPGTLDDVLRLLPPPSIAAIRSELSEIHAAGARHGIRPPRILMVPLAGTDCGNPSDFRRIELVRRALRINGYEAAVVSKEEALETACHIVYSQDRDYGFWNRHAPRLRGEGKSLVFSCSDLLAYDRVSKAHSYESYLCGGSKREAEELRPLAEFLSHCSLVVAGSTLQARRIEEIAGDRGPPVISDFDPVDTETYRRIDPAPARPPGEFRIVWEGYVDNVPYLIPIAGAVRRLASERDAKVVVLASRNRRTPFLGTDDNRRLAESVFGGGLVEFHEWERETAGAFISTADAGVVPLFADDPFCAAKPPNKGIIFNHMGLPVVASPSPANEAWVFDGFNGYIARNEEEWLRCLRRLASDPETARRMGRNGQAKAAGYTPEAVAKRLIPHIDRLFRGRTA